MSFRRNLRLPRRSLDVTECLLKSRALWRTSGKLIAMGFTLCR
jgi:hypothetical protein